jgi:serine O-acetyltransferase
MNNYKKDLYRYGGLTGFLGFYKGFLFPGFVYTYFFRKASKYNRKSIMGLYYRVVLRRKSYKYGIQIPAGTEIGDGFYIGHFGNIVVSNKAKIGKNCNIAQGVTIGMSNRGEKKGAPTIADEVWIGANSVLVGKISIGYNVLIAPLSYVNFDVPSNSIVINGRIISREDATNGYINNKV